MFQFACWLDSSTSCTSTPLLGEHVQRRECTPSGAFVSRGPDSSGPVYLKDCPPPAGVLGFLPVHCGSPRFSNSISLIPRRAEMPASKSNACPCRSVSLPIAAAEAPSRTGQRFHFLADLHRFH
jgi:hypothetical protein